MDLVMGKYNAYDFFNLIFSGVIFLLGLQLLGMDVNSIIFNSIIICPGDGVGTVFEIVEILFACYVIGSCLQAVGSLVERIFLVQKYASTHCLTDSRIVRNEVKLEVYKRMADELYKSREIVTKEDEELYKENLDEYFLAHCEYCNQVNSNSKKTENMREVRGFSNLLMSCFLVLGLIGFFGVIFSKGQCPQQSGSLSFVYFVLSVMFFFRMKKDTWYRVRMVLGIYEASFGKEVFGEENQAVEKD